MITIAQAVEQTVTHSPLYGEAMLHRIVNHSAIARKIKPTVEEVLLEPVTEGAITIALKRYAEKLHKEHKPICRNYSVRSMSIRSDLTALIYQNSPVLQTIHQKILPMSISKDAFMHFAQGSHESSFIVSNACLALLKKLAVKEKMVAEYPNLSAISVRMPPEVMHVTGVFAPFVQALAWRQISVYQIVSHFTEITFLVSDKDADQAFDAIKGCGSA
ncbi:ACT domain-containing protein [Candidatus Peregrinibacteria bacterium]|nr:ACT domain-containing protein [Candidatus Peregrinibacteria bacterium]